MQPAGQRASAKPIAREYFTGLLLGTAVGDALGLPAENLSPRRVRRLCQGEWRMRLLLGRGMTSDDTEHTLMVAQCLLCHPHDPAAFQQTLARKLRWWFASLSGGVGLATAKACLKLWLGFPAGRAAVRSGGSGPAMRSAIIGAYFAEDATRRRDFVIASSRLTHSGWQAEVAALGVGEVAALARIHPGVPNATRVLAALAGICQEQEWQQCLAKVKSSLHRNDSVAEFARGLGLERGVSGYSLHVVPVALFAWLRHGGDFRRALTAALDCGGDTDTVGAILGALCGASSGPEGIPGEWIDSLAEWPRSVTFIRAVGHRLADQKETGQPLGELRYFWPALIPRNLLFIVVILVHGLRRLLPPY